MRLLQYILLAVGLWMLGTAGYQQYRGVTTEPVLVGNGNSPTILEAGHIVRTSAPDAFHRAMTFHWIYACLTMSMGVILALIIRGQDRVDPMSPDFNRKDQEEP